MKHLPPVDDDVYAALQRHAEPLVDDINSVLRRLLACAEATRDTSGRAAMTPANVTPHRRVSRRMARGDADYELPLLRALIDLGGKAATSEVIEKVGEVLSDQLGPVDKERLPSSGLVRWTSRTQFARLNLVKRGEMDGTTPRGIWAITEQGRARVDDSGSTR